LFEAGSYIKTGKIDYIDVLHDNTALTPTDGCRSEKVQRDSF